MVDLKMHPLIKVPVPKGIRRSQADRGNSLSLSFTPSTRFTCSESAHCISFLLWISLQPPQTPFNSTLPHINLYPHPSVLIGYSTDMSHIPLYFCVMSKQGGLDRHFGYADVDVFSLVCPLPARPKVWGKSYRYPEYFMKVETTWDRTPVYYASTVSLGANSYHSLCTYQQIFMSSNPEKVLHR